jgi:hypothetical protein
MTVYEIKTLYKRNNPEGHFFDNKTMRFFGDTLKNFGVRDGGIVKVTTENGVEDVEVWELYRKRPVHGGLHGFCRHFSKKDGEEITDWGY